MFGPAPLVACRAAVPRCCERYPVKEELSLANASSAQSAERGDTAAAARRRRGDDGRPSRSKPRPPPRTKRSAHAFIFAGRNKNDGGVAAPILASLFLHVPRNPRLPAGGRYALATAPLPPAAPDDRSFSTRWCRLGCLPRCPKGCPPLPPGDHRQPNLRLRLTGLSGRADTTGERSITTRTVFNKVYVLAARINGGEA